MDLIDFALHPVRNDTDHRAALTAIEALWNAEPGTAEYDRLDLLATRVEAYEDKRWPAADLDPRGGIAS